MSALGVLRYLVALGFGLVPLPNHGLRITRPTGTVLPPALRQAVDQHRVTLRPWVDPAALRLRLRVPATVPIDPQLAVVLAWLAASREQFDETERAEYIARIAPLDARQWFERLDVIESIAVQKLSGGFADMAA